MLTSKNNKVEQFYDFLDNTTLFVYEQTKKTYLDSLLLVVDYVLGNEESLNQLNESTLSELDRHYQTIENMSFNKEEIRKAYQLCVFKGFKHLNQSISEITPDSIGMLFAYFVDLFYGKEDTISVLDANVGCGNLLFTMMNNSNKDYQTIYGIDMNQNYLNIALHLANLSEYHIEFFNQNNLTNLLVPSVDLIISDLPVGSEKIVNNELICANKGITYQPYLMIENLMKYIKPGGYLFYLIPNDFFTQDNNDVIKDIIIKDSYIQAIIELPYTLFKEEKFRKSILILRKKGAHILNQKEILMLKFPDFKEQTKVMSTIDKINQWFQKIQQK